MVIKNVKQVNANGDGFDYMPYEEVDGKHIFYVYLYNLCCSTKLLPSFNIDINSVQTIYAGQVFEFNGAISNSLVRIDNNDIMFVSDNQGGEYNCGNTSIARYYDFLKRDMYNITYDPNVPHTYGYS